MNRCLAWIAVTLMVALVGCAAVEEVKSGETVVGGRLAVNADGPWNRFAGGGGESTPVWTVEGFQVDALRFYTGIADGKPVASVPQSKDTTGLVFRSTMRGAELVALYQSLYTRDGSTFRLDRVEPAEFIGTQGVRFEFQLDRQVDSVRLRGLGYAAVVGGELHAIVYAAPRLAFFPAHSARVEALMRSARLRGG